MASDKQSQTEWVIIGAGLQRTGTNTLKTVIEDLLGKRCYHMKEVFPSNHTEFWLSALKGEEKSKEEWKELLKDFAAGVDVPVCLFVKELMVSDLNPIQVRLFYRLKAPCYDLRNHSS